MTTCMFPRYSLTTLTRRKERNRTKTRNQPRKRNYFSYSNRKRTGNTVDSARRRIRQCSMIVWESRVLELPKQQWTRQRTNPSKKISRWKVTSQRIWARSKLLHYEFNEEEYDIVCCTQILVTVDYKCIGNRTSNIFKQYHQMIQDSWQQMDNCSTINIICNPHHLTNIHKVDQRCIITTNDGTSSTNLKATLKLRYPSYEGRSLVWL